VRKVDLRRLRGLGVDGSTMAGWWCWRWRIPPIEITAWSAQNRPASTPGGWALTGRRWQVGGVGDEGSRRLKSRLEVHKVDLRRLWGPGRLRVVGGGVVVLAMKDPGDW